MDEALKRRAKAVLPSLTHLSILGLPPGYSQFFTDGAGCRVTDVDGKVYIDYMCSYGPILLGHQHPVVEAAIRSQQEKGDCLAGPTERMVELAELLTTTVPWAAWCYFAKNGGDATSLAVRMVRAQTGRKVILRAPQSYHGAASIWREGSAASLTKEGVAAGDVANLLPFRFNDLESVREAAQRAGDDWAGIIVAAFRWDYGVPQEIATKEFLVGVRKLCDEKGAALICDDVRSSFRMDPRGTWSDERYGHGVSPDLTCLCKGIANGQPLSAILGSEAWRPGATRIVATGSFWANSVPFAAALATIPLAAAAAASAEQCGLRLREGLERQARAAGLGDDFQQTGPPQMPYFHFESEREARMGQRRRIWTFCSVAASRGVIFHPFHTMFLNGAHTVEDVDATLQITKHAFAEAAAVPAWTPGSKSKF